MRKNKSLKLNKHYKKVNNLNIKTNLSVGNEEGAKLYLQNAATKK